MRTPKPNTVAAADLVEREGMSQYAAAKKFGVPFSTLNSYMARRRASAPCPCCAREGLLSSFDLAALSPAARKALK